MTKKPLFDIKEAIFEERNYLAKKYNALAHKEVVASFFEKNYKAIDEQKASFGNGMPSALYYTWNTENETTDIAIAMPLKEIPKSIAKGFELISIPETTGFYINYYGSYANMEPAHTALSNYIIENNLGKNYVAIEEYITDPASEPKPTNWLTKISYLKL